MRLLLTVVGEEGFELGHRARCTFDTKGGTIGRNSNCHWVLPDPTNTVSARHAMVAHNGRGFLITDTSTNGVFINTVDAPLGRGNDAILSAGDTLYIGHYVMSVDFVEDEAPSAGLGSPRAAPAPVEAPRPAPAVPPLPPVQAKAAPSAADARRVLPDDIDDMLKRPSQQAPSLPGFAQPPAPRTPPLPGASVIPDDFFSDLIGSAKAPAAGLRSRPFPAAAPAVPVNPADRFRPNPAPSPSRTDWAPLPDLSDLLPTAQPRNPMPPPLPPAAVGAPPGDPFAMPQASLPERPPLPPLPPAPAPEPIVAPLPQEPLYEAPPPPPTAASPSAPPAEANGAHLDPIAMLRRRASAGAPPAAVSAPPPTLARPADPPGRPLPAVAAPLPSRPVLPEAPRSRMPAAMPLPAPTAASSSRRARSESPASGAAAFWTALGIDVSALAPEDQTALLGELGAALREAMNGIVPVLAARRSLKDAFRMDQTQLQGRDNNPLKFLPSGDAVLQALAAQKLAGFLPLPAAVQEGFGDIRAHEMAAVVAMQATVKNLLARCDPATIEAQVGKTSRLFGGDKTKFWDQFVAWHGSATARPDETARQIVNEEFSRAYADQVKAGTQGDNR